MKQANFLYTSELEGMTSTCFKALEGSNYDVRVCVAQLIGTLMAMTQQTPSAATVGKGKKSCSLEEVFASMSGGFLRGGIGFLKGSGGELLKSIAPREVRVGVTQVSCCQQSFPWGGWGGYSGLQVMGRIASKQDLQ